jgi:Na+-driven multidrug efflux pump
VLATGEAYLQRVAPFYGAIGLGTLLFFASQGAGRVFLPFLAGTARLIVGAGLGWVAVVHLGVGLRGLFVILATASLVFGGVNLVVMLSAAWGRFPQPAGPVARQAKA